MLVRQLAGFGSYKRRLCETGKWRARRRFAAGGRGVSI